MAQKLAQITAGVEEIKRSFNEAAPVMAQKSEECAVLQQAPDPASMRLRRLWRRNYRDGTAVDLPGVCFNEAAPVMAQKFHNFFRCFPFLCSFNEAAPVMAQKSFARPDPVAHPEASMRLRRLWRRNVSFAVSSMDSSNGLQ